MHHTRCFLYGLFFAVLQYFYFLNLELALSATAIVYLAVVLSWLAGTWVGLNLIRSERMNLNLLIGITVYLVTVGGMIMFPFDQRFLPLYTLCVGASGLSVGVFFRSFAKHFREAKALFFSENNGFILGLFVALWGFLQFGRPFTVVFPLILSIVLLTLEAIAHLRRLDQSRASVGSTVLSNIPRSPVPRAFWPKERGIE